MPCKHRLFKDILNKYAYMSSYSNHIKCSSPQPSMIKLILRAVFKPKVVPNLPWPDSLLLMVEAAIAMAVEG